MKCPQCHGKRMVFDDLVGRRGPCSTCGGDGEDPAPHRVPTSPDQSRPPAPPTCSVCGSPRHTAQDVDPCIHCAPQPPEQQPQPTAAYITGLEPPLMTDRERLLTWEIEVLQANYDAVLAQRDRYLLELQQTRAVVERFKDYDVLLRAWGQRIDDGNQRIDNSPELDDAYEAILQALDALSAGSSRPVPESEP